MTVFNGNYLDIPLAVARGLIGGSINFGSYGRLVSTGVHVGHLIWPLENGPLVVPGESGVTLSVTSSSAQDSAAGTGLRSGYIHYLDGDLNPQSLLFTPTGTTPLVTAITDCRWVQCVHGLSFGSGGAAAGNISITSGADTYSYIPTGARRCASSARRVPAGKRLIINALYGSAISGTSATEVEISLAMTYIEGHDLTEAGITFPHMEIGVQDGAVPLSGLRLPVPEGVIVALEAHTENKTATINAGFNGWLEDA